MVDNGIILYTIVEAISRLNINKNRTKMTASKVKIKKVCEWCGQEFIAWKVSTRFCSKQCNSHAYKDAIRKRVLLQTERETMEKAEKISASKTGNQDYMSIAEAASLLGVTRMTVYNLIYSNVLRASKITSRLTFVRRCDIDAMLTNANYTKRLNPEHTPITEFYTTKEIQEKFGVSEAWVFKLAKEKKIPKVLHHGKTYWSKQHVEKHFAKHIENNNIVEWYSVQDMMEKFNMTTSAVYCFVSKFNIPKKKIKTLVYYSKQHVDAAKGINEPPKEEFYTMKEAVQHFGMTEDQIYKYAKKAKVSKHMEGRIVLMNKRELDAALAPPSI